MVGSLSEANNILILHFSSGVPVFYLVRKLVIHDHHHQFLVSGTTCCWVKQHGGLTKCD